MGQQLMPPGSPLQEPVDSPLVTHRAHSQLCSTGKSFHMGEMGKRKVPHSQLTFLTSFWAAFQDTRETCTCIARLKVSTINVLMREKRQADNTGG